MVETGMMPNEVVFLSLLSACGHCGLVNEGWHWFYSMKGKFGIDPTVAHYTCMLNMLGRQGRVEQALQFVKKMPVRADAAVWGALLGWCRATRRDVKVAEFAAQQIVGLGASDSCWYVTLAKLYWELGMWEDVRMAEWSKAPDSSSGPRERAWVQIPLLTIFSQLF
uniref:Pentatricopeptide repeat-containing protein n=1 Tax=Ananas comosus var. bracteatus TaxID=296719 RepID=A0A6V7QSZ7_ANACO